MKDASVLFSGGPDSTLAVLYALEEFEKVHLLTFHHSLMNRTGRQSIVTEELRRIFGKERIIEYGEHIDALYKKCYFSRMARLITKYRTFYVPWLCGACKMAMHLRTIVYNKEQGITTTYDGANIESAPYFPAQSKEYIEVMKGLYKSYGMQYECPVYDVSATDKEAEKYGMLSIKDTKKEHVVFSTQHSCFIGLLIHAHARLYYRPFRGSNRMESLAGKFLTQMANDLLPEVEPWTYSD